MICKTCKKEKPSYKGKLCHSCYLSYAVAWRLRAKNKKKHRIAHAKCKDKDPAWWSTLTLIKRGDVKHKFFPGDLEKMEVIYKRSRHLTKTTGIAHSVDHIVPLKGVNVCGLHVSWNMQILTLKANISKGNRFNDI